MLRNRAIPAGYKLSIVPFENGKPVADSESKTAAIDVLANADNSACPENCFRPVGIAFDGQGRLFMSSDATGEIYVVMKAQASTPTDGNTTTPTDGNTTTPSPSATNSTSPVIGKSMYFLLSICSFAFSIFISLC